MARISKKTYLVTDNFFFGERDGFISFGFRTVWKGASLDYGVIRFVSEDGIFGPLGLPWVGVSVPFYRKRKSK